MNKKRVLWLERLVEAVTGPMIAILFWLTMILIVLMTFAHGQFFTANFFEAFGAIGQVAFAAGVFWIALQQFEFTKHWSRRQDRIETYGMRKELLDRFRSLYDMAKDSTEFVNRTDYISAWYELADEVSRVFDTEIDLKIVMMAEDIAEVQDDTQFRKEVAERFKDDFEGQQKFLKDNWKKISDAYFVIWFMMHQELIIGNSKTNPGFDCDRTGQTFTPERGWEKP